MLDLFRKDAAHAARSLRRSPLFTTIAVLSVAIGIGATTGIVTLANALLFKSAPGIGAPDRLVGIGGTRNGRGFDNFAYPTFVAYRERTTSLTGISAIQIDPMSLSLRGPNGGEPVQGTIVSGNFFQVLQARPHLGRFFVAEEDSIPRENPVVVLSHKFWRERFNGDPAIVGQKIVLNGTPFTVVGVAAEKFQGPFVLAPDMWVPAMSAPLIGRGEGLIKCRECSWIMALGRLAPNVSVSQAQAELATVAHQLQVDYPKGFEGKGVSVQPLTFFPGGVRNMIAGFMAVLLAVAGLVLLIASTNVAGMLLARASARQREIAVRLAVGATRAQLIRQLVTESVLLFVLSGFAGLLLANWLVAGMMALIPKLPVQLYFDPGIDWRVLTFAMGVTLVSGLAAGLIPALQATKPSLVPALKSEGGGSGKKLRLRSALLVTQIAFSMLLLIVAGLFARALVRARTMDAGFDPRGVQISALDLQLVNYDAKQGQPFVETLRERVGRIPGVQSTALAAMLPLDGGGLGLGGIEVPDRPPPDAKHTSWDADWNVITPGYFETMRLPIVRGRDFNDRDREGSPDVAIFNERFAARVWPGEDPIGKTFRNEGRTVTIVGIARDSKYRSLGEDPINFLYVPLAQRYFQRTHLLVRAGENAPVAGPIRRIVAALEPSLPILSQKTFEEHAAMSLFPQRLALWVAGSLGVVALLLALLGIYGVTAYTVTQRTREIGVRLAVGAQRNSVLGLILRQGLTLAGIGVAVGALLGFGATRLLRALLYGVPASDVIAFGGAAVLLVVAALAASWIPAMRAAAVDPVVALRAD